VHVGNDVGNENRPFGSRALKFPATRFRREKQRAFVGNESDPYSPQLIEVKEG
jgi:hypothetical protein